MKNIGFAWIGMIVGCGGDVGDDKDLDPDCFAVVTIDGAELEVDTTVADFDCAVDVVLVGECDAIPTIEGIKVEGSGAAPASVAVRNPASCTGALAGNTEAFSAIAVGDGWQAVAANHPSCPVGGTDSARLECNSIPQAQDGPWRLFLPTHPDGACSDYGSVTFEFLGGASCEGDQTTPTN